MLAPPPIEQYSPLGLYYILIQENRSEHILSTVNSDRKTSSAPIAVTTLQLTFSAGRPLVIEHGDLRKRLRCQ